MSQILAAISGHEVVIYSPDRPADSLCDYLRDKGSLVSVVGDPTGRG